MIRCGVIPRGRPALIVGTVSVFLAMVIGVTLGLGTGALGRRTAFSHPATASPADWGLGLLIVGAIVLLAGLVVIAARRPT